MPPASPPDETRVRKLVHDAVERALGPEPPAPAAAAAPGPARVVAADAARRVAIGSDHGGFALKEILERVIQDELGWQVLDVGTHST